MIDTVVAPALAGLVTGLGLIVAIGAQNAFVLRQGLARRHVTVVVAICAVSDLVLITAGVAGVGALVSGSPHLLTAIRWAGAAFLTWYGGRALLRARRPGSLAAARDDGGSRRRTAATALALTWLNPHVYLDTVLLLGTVASTHGSSGRWWFGLGAGLASIAWFTALGFGTRPLAPLLATPRAWQVLEVLVGLTMLGVALGLLLG